MIRVLAAAAMLTLLAGCERQPSNVRAQRTAIPVAARVVVLEGDTLVIDGRHYRLANVVSPQSIPSARCWGEAMAAKQAVQYVKALLRDAKDIHVKPTGELDSWGRHIASVSLDGLDLARAEYDGGVAAMPKDGRFRWCEPIGIETDGGPRWSTISEPGQG